MSNARDAVATSARDNSSTNDAVWRRIAPGGLLMALAILTLYGTSKLEVGTAIHMGPGALADILAVILFILGAVVALEGALRRQFGGGA
jgi:hypothetical protein